MKKFVLSLWLVLYFGGCGAKVAVPATQVLHNESAKTFTLHTYKGDVAYQDLLKDDLSMPKAGEKNSYDILITKELEIAYATYLGGDGEKALEALEKAQKSSSDTKFLWQVAFLKTKIYMMMGLSADALESVDQAEKLEVTYAHTNINSRSLRGEVKIWLEDYAGAEKDFYQVLESIGAWEMPTSYMMPPSNMTELVNTTTAQLRAMTGLAAIYDMNGQYEKAITYASEAEKRYNSIHFVANHPLYGIFLKLHLDSYYGRAMNLTFLASALTSLKQEPFKAQDYFEKALSFFEKIGYLKGKATVLALKARAYNISGQYDKCNMAGEKALAVSLQSGMIDFVWRIEALRGDTFYKLGAKVEAEKAYRRAFDTLNIISGMLHSDTSKRTFGIGKEQITEALVAFDIEAKDYKKLFKDLEDSRARAFVDMLASRSVFVHQNKKLEHIRTLDRDIAKQMLLNTQTQKVQTMIKARQAEAKALALEDPQLSSVVAIWSTTLASVQKRLQKDEAMLYFLPTKSDASLSYLLIEPKQMRVQTVDLSKDALQTLLKSLVQAVKNEKVSRGLKRHASETAHKVFSMEQLIQKLQKSFKLESLKQKKLYIVADKNLNYLPWGLIDKSHEIALLPNGSWLNINQEQIKGQAKVIVGDPNFGGELPQLNGAKEEALALAKVYQTRALIGDDASIEMIRKALGKGAEVLHLATHAIFYEDKPLESALFFSKDKKSDPLTAEAIYKNPLPAKLVVLSACQTGVGKAMEDSDFLGLERSFYLGGTKAILSSLWEVDDEGTKKFMLIFHAYAKEGNYAKGWYEAKESLKHEGYSPAVYGAFVLHGTNRE